MAKERGGKPRGLLADLPIDQIVRLPELQLRAGGTDPDHVEALAEAVRRRQKLPRVQVRRVEGRGDLLTDGFHTVAAYLKAGRKTVPANVLKGTWHDAMADALKANVQHERAGLRRSTKDKQRVVAAALATFPSWSNRLIAEHCGVSDEMVRDHRKTLKSQGDSQGQVPESGTCDTQEEVRTGRDGKKYAVPQKPAEAAWRAIPLKEFLDVADFVWAALKLAKLETAGQLFKQIANGATFGLKDTTVRDLLDAVQELDGFDGRLSEAAEGRGPKAGTERFNWNHADGPYGALVRAVDAVAEHHAGENGSTEFQGLMRLMSEFRTLWDGWQKRLTNKREAA